MIGCIRMCKSVSSWTTSIIPCEWRRFDADCCLLSKTKSQPSFPHHMFSSCSHNTDTRNNFLAIQLTPPASLKSCVLRRCWLLSRRSLGKQVKSILSLKFLEPTSRRPQRAVYVLYVLYYSVQWNRQDSVGFTGSPWIINSVETTFGNLMHGDFNVH